MRGEEEEEFILRRTQVKREGERETRLENEGKKGEWAFVRG